MDDVTGWLLGGDPAIRWQTMRDLATGTDVGAVAERDRVATTGWGQRILDLQEDGQWARGAYFPGEGWRPPGGPVGDPDGQPWTGTLPTLRLLREFGIDPHAPSMQAAVDDVRETCRWEHAGQRFFDGEVEECINGGALAVGAYFGQPVDGIASRLVDEQMGDGGWNCERETGSTRGSFHSTMCVLDGLLEYERSDGPVPVAEARARGEEYLLARGLFRGARSGEVIDPDWLRFSFPTEWYYDVLRGLDYFRASGRAPDPRLEEAIAVLRDKRQPDGTWLLENTHPGLVHFEMERGDGAPSRWNTLRALRVLRWYEAE